AAYQGMYEFSKKLYKTKFYSKLYYMLTEKIKKNKGEFTSRFKPNKIKDLDQLNESKKEWDNPWDNRNKRNESFEELFHKGVAESIPMLEAVFKAYNGEIMDITVINETGANSMATG